MPRTTTGPDSRTGHLLDIHVEVGRDLLNVVEVLELLEQLDYRLRVLSGDVYRALWNESDLRLGDRESGFLEAGLDVVHRVRVGRDDELLALDLEIFGAGVQRRFHGCILFVLGRIDVDLSLPIEQVRHRIRGSQVAAEPRELVPDLGDGARGIVAQRGNQDRDATRSISLVGDFGVMNSFELSRPFLDRALDVFLGHRPGLGRVYRGSKPGIVRGITAGELRRHRDLTNELRELGAALGVGGRLVMLDLLPLAMAGHTQLG